jgi:hypothetical protein
MIRIRYLMANGEKVFIVCEFGEREFEGFGGI